MTDIKIFGAIGDGVADDTASIQKALNEAGEVYFPAGKYKVSATLKIKSNTTIKADKAAYTFLADHSMHERFDFMFCNEDMVGGNENIVIDGGIWDGNCGNNPRGELFGGGYTGTMFNFRKVKNVSLLNIEFRNPECYYTRFTEVDGITVDNIWFNSSIIRPNQDGIHLAGFCYNAVITNLKGSNRSPNDDFVALNADDCLRRLQNLDCLNGEIKNVVVDNLYSPYCHSFVRLLSVDSPISDVKMSNMKGTCKCFAINADGARYILKASRFLNKDDERYYTGSGMLTNIAVNNMEIYSRTPQKAIVLVETNCKNFVINNFKSSRKYMPLTHAVSVGYNAPHTVTVATAKGAKVYKKALHKRVNLKPTEYNSITIDMD
ncbi:MAG: glycosyl hydrolase family 28-related protein [Bacillota bacterium]